MTIGVYIITTLLCTYRFVNSIITLIIPNNITANPADAAIQSIIFLIMSNIMVEVVVDFVDDGLSI